MVVTRSKRNRRCVEVPTGDDCDDSVVLPPQQQQQQQQQQPPDGIEFFGSHQQTIVEPTRNEPMANGPLSQEPILDYHTKGSIHDVDFVNWTLSSSSPLRKKARKRRLRSKVQGVEYALHSMCSLFTTSIDDDAEEFPTLHVEKTETLDTTIDGGCGNEDHDSLLPPVGDRSSSPHTVTTTGTFLAEASFVSEATVDHNRTFVSSSSIVSPLEDDDDDDALVSSAETLFLERKDMELGWEADLE